METKTVVCVYEGEELIYNYKMLPLYLPREGEYIHIKGVGIYKVLKVCHAILENNLTMINIFTKKVEQ